MSEPISQLDRALAELMRLGPAAGLALSSAQVDAFSTYLRELEAYNAHINLVSCADPQVVVRDHIADSLSLVAVLSDLGATGGRLVDIGSGAGFPGMVLAIALSDMKFCLIESTKKKARFLDGLVERLGLGVRVIVLAERAEMVAHDKRWRASFDFATARAVGALDLVSELALPVLKKGGWLLAQKSSAQVEEENRRAARALPLLGGELRQVVALPRSVAGAEHVVIIIARTGECPARFPRPAAQMKRLPLARFALNQG